MAMGGSEAEVLRSHWSERCGGGVDASAGETDMSGGPVEKMARVSTAKNAGMHTYL